MRLKRRMQDPRYTWGMQKGVWKLRCKEWWNALEQWLTRFSIKKCAKCRLSRCNVQWREYLLGQIR